MSKKEVIKHSGAIHVSNSVGLMARRVWNVLLARAYDDLPQKTTFSIKVEDLMETMDVTSRNTDHLKGLLRVLISTIVEWNILGKDSTDWEASALLARAGIKGGWCHYEYSSSMREKLYNPKIYARISLSIQNRFNSKHSLAMYELAVDYFDLNRLYGETPFIEIDRFRQLMGLGDGEYDAFKYLNHWVIKPAVREINKKSDLLVEVELRRAGRRVEAIKMIIRRNPRKMDSLISPGESKPPRTLFPDLNEEEDAFDIWLAALPDDRRLKVRQKAISRLSPEEKIQFRGEEKSWAIEAQVQMYMRKIWQDETSRESLEPLSPPVEIITEVTREKK